METRDNSKVKFKKNELENLSSFRCLGFRQYGKNLTFLFFKKKKKSRERKNHYFQK